MKVYNLDDLYHSSIYGEECVELKKAIEMGKIRDNDGAPVLWDEVEDCEGDVCLDGEAYSDYANLFPHRQYC